MLLMPITAEKEACLVTPCVCGKLGGDLCETSKPELSLWNCSKGWMPIGAPRTTGRSGTTPGWKFICVHPTQRRNTLITPP